LTRPEHRSIPCSVMRYIPWLLLLFILTAGAERAYSQRLPDPMCPTISVECSDSDDSSTFRFTAKAGSAPSDKLSFKWTVSAGTITAGQSTASIVVEKAGFGGRTFTAIVEVGGLPEGCENKASCSMIFCDLVVARKFDEYGSETKAVGQTQPRSKPHRRTRRVTYKPKAST